MLKGSLISMFNVNMFDGEGDLRDFKDICICALRYALPRHTYVVEEVCSFVKKHADDILDRRVIGVMLRDIKEQLDYYYFHVAEMVGKYDWQCDLDCIKDLKEFLINYDKSNFSETSKD